MIQVFKPYYDHEEIEAVSEVIRSGWVGLGPKTAQFEKEFAEFCGVKHCVGLNSCTAALDMALRLLGVNHGHEVIVPTMTFVSTGHCVVYNLATPIFADIDEDTLNIDIEDVARKMIDAGQCEIMVVSLGAGGASLITSDSYEFIRSPTVPIKSAVGAGDSMVGAMVLSLARGKSVIEAARYGVVAGAAAVMTPGSELCRYEDVARLYQKMSQ